VAFFQMTGWAKLRLRKTQWWPSRPPKILWCVWRTKDLFTRFERQD